MAEVPTVPRIHKKHIAAIRMPRALFHLPESNRYFARIKQDRGVLSSSLQANEEQPERDKQEAASHQENAVVRSASLQLSRKLSSAKTQQKMAPYLSQVHSLPKIQKKLPENAILSQIVKSELGCFNYYQIIKQKYQLDEKRLFGSHLTHMSSFISEEQAPLDDEPHVDESGKAKEVPYDEYDKVLMQQEPVIYRRRVFKLKHKADWSISK